MRILLCRLSPHNLSSFWPVILTELVRICSSLEQDARLDIYVLNILLQFRVFEQILVAPPADESDELLLILSACKFLDLLVVLQTEEFQVYVPLLPTP